MRAAVSAPGRRATASRESIVVTAELLEQPATESTAAVTVLTREQLELPAQTLGDALRLVPGLAGRRTRKRGAHDSCTDAQA